jgi:hypothetical protein
LIWWNTVDVNTFFPRCYDLTDGNELEDFKQEYRFQRVRFFINNIYLRLNLWSKCMS